MSLFLKQASYRVNYKEKESYTKNMLNINLKLKVIFHIFFKLIIYVKVLCAGFFNCHIRQKNKVKITLKS